MSEFEDRENGLGELPATIMRERGELFRDAKDRPVIPNEMPANLKIPADVRQQGDALQIPGGIGSVPMAFDVTSVFDARPVNGRDFLYTETITFFFEEDAGPP